MRLGRIPWINCYPVYGAIDRALVPVPADLVTGTASELNDLLAAGELDVSAVSAVEYARNAAAYHLLPDLAITCDGPVHSVMLLSRRPVHALDGATVLRTLYLPEDRPTWGGGLVIGRMARLLAWMDTIFGAYPWPQFTALHRIEGGGTEFPMVVMNGGPSEGLIFHEGGHQYLYGILGNNEWKDGWLDEGFTSFQTDWYFHARGQNDVWRNAFLESAQWDSAGKSQPLQTAAADFRDFEAYAVMTYTKPEAVYRMLQAYIGEATFTRGLHIYYEQNKLRHVSLPDFRRAMEQASGNNLRWFFDEWFRRADRLDYSFGKARVTAAPGGGFRTRLEVLRTGNAWMPITLQIGDTRQLLDSHSRKQTVDVHTEERPTEAILDPDWVVLDYRRGNNVKVLK